jgi:hypothetical protein
MINITDSQVKELITKMPFITVEKENTALTFDISGEAFFLEIKYETYVKYHRHGGGTQDHIAGFDFIVYDENYDPIELSPIQSEVIKDAIARSTEDLPARN